MQPTRDQRFATLYRRIPNVNCKGLCHDACGVILCSPHEKKRALAGGEITEHSDALTCPLLTKDNRCSSYEHRPTVCRLFGAIDGEMECPHGCKPEQPLSRQEAAFLIQKSYEIGGGQDMINDPETVYAEMEKLRAELDREDETDPGR